MTPTRSHLADSPGQLLKFALAAVLSGVIAVIASLPVSASGPTCAELMGIENHGKHIVGDYVTEVGHGNLAWPPAGAVGQVIADTGAAQPGAPGIHTHGGGTAQPGASFCNPQANSPTGGEIPRGRQ